MSPINLLFDNAPRNGQSTTASRKTLPSCHEQMCHAKPWARLPPPSEGPATASRTVTSHADSARINKLRSPNKHPAVIYFWLSFRAIRAGSCTWNYPTSRRRSAQLHEANLLVVALLCFFCNLSGLARNQVQRGDCLRHL